MRLKYKQGSLTGFQDIYTENYGKLLRVAVKMTGNGESARDIVHDVFECFFLRMNEGHIVLNPSNWLYKAVINRSADLIRRKSKLRNLNPEWNMEAEEPAGLKEHQSAAVHKALSTLKPGDRALAVLYSEGLSYREISQSAGIRFTSVGKKIARVLLKLEIELKKEKYELY